MNVFVEDADGCPRFLMHFRAVDPESVDALKAAAEANSLGARITIVMQLGLRFCPWCGKELLKWYRKQLNVLPRLDHSI